MSRHIKTKITAASIIGCLLALVISSQQQSKGFPNNQQVDAVTVRVIDGDTLAIGKQKIRLWGIDAPELHQTCYKDKNEIQCGRAAKLALMSLISSGELNCSLIDRDRYHREVSKCQVDDLDIGRLLITSGWALNYETYSHGYYKEWEEQARSEKSGLWSMTFTKPWDWRRGDRVYNP